MCMIFKMGHLENTGLLSYADLPTVDIFNYTISKVTLTSIITLIPFERLQVLGSCQAHCGRLKFSIEISNCIIGKTLSCFPWSDRLTSFLRKCQPSKVWITSFQLFVHVKRTFYEKWPHFNCWSNVKLPVRRQSLLGVSKPKIIIHLHHGASSPDSMLTKQLFDIWTTICWTSGRKCQVARLM